MSQSSGSGSSGSHERQVRDVAERSRFEITVGGELAGFADYRLDETSDGAVMVFPHTVVEERHGGQGVGGDLVRGALDAARERGMLVRPVCWFVEGWIDRHPDYADLVE